MVGGAHLRIPKPFGSSRGFPVPLNCGVCEMAVKRRKVHSWEAGGNQATHSWEAPGPAEPPSAGASSDSDEGEPSASECVKQFIAVLVGLFMSGAIPANILCILCYWANGFFQHELLKKFAYKPGQPNGHYQRHLANKLDFKTHKAGFYYMNIPGHKRHDLSRSTNLVPVRPVHEAIDGELAGDPTILARLRDLVRRRALPKAYFRHPVVRSTSALVVPLGLFIDGVPYSHTDSLVGVWAANLVSGARHFIMGVRKRTLCRCGCRAWCSYDAIFRFLHWCFKNLAVGAFPGERHDSEVWRETDGLRADKAGTGLQARGALLYIKGDWSEYTNTFGFTAWNATERPCLFCRCSREQMYTVQGLSPSVFPFEVISHEAYAAACERCEKKVEVAHEVQYRALRAMLRYDKRQNGSHGLALTADFPSLGLLAGDRLEPSADFQDIGAVFSLSDFPATLTFWRPSQEDGCHHRCPLFDASLGITLPDSVTVDELHTLNLGVYAVWCRTAAWMLFDARVWAAAAGTGEEAFKVTVLCMRQDLTAFYKARKADRPDEELTRVHDLTTKMFGTRERPKLKLSGAETWSFMLYLVYAVQKFQNSLPPKATELLEAGKLLVRLHDILREEGALPTRSAIQDRQGPKAPINRILGSVSFSTEVAQGRLQTLPNLVS